MIKQSNGILRLGTSGIVVPGNKLSFPAAFQYKSRLNYYGSLFNTLEINSTFYKVPMQSTFEKCTGCTGTIPVYYKALAGDYACKKSG